MKRLIALFLSITLLIGCFYTAYADMSIMASEIIASYSCGISKTGTTVKGTARITSTTLVSKLGISSIKIQEYRDGKWVTVKTGSASSSSNTLVHSIPSPLTYSGTPGLKYRCVAEVYGTNHGVTDSRTATSPTLTL